VADLKTVLAREFSLDHAADLATRVKVSRLVVAWTNASARVSKAAEVEGELEAQRLTKPLHVSDYTAMRAAFEQRWWVLEDKQVPSRSYLEKKLEYIERDEPRAEPLSEVTNREEGDEPEVLQPVWDTQGQLRVKRGVPTVPLPQNPEQLRRRVVLMGTAWLFCGVKHTNRAWLKDLNPQLWQDLLDYLLGEHVYGLVAKDSAGRTLTTPGWHQVLEYEHAIRREACRRVAQARGTLAECLREAAKDPVTKERYFTTPVAFAALADNRGGGYAPAPQQPRSSGPYTPVATKGKGKSKTKGKNGPPQGCAATSPDGKPICYRYNSKDDKCTGRCNFQHICGRCFGKHPLWQCRGNTSGPPVDVRGETRGGSN
jgi:hypothetical protein